MTNPWEKFTGWIDKKIIEKIGPVSKEHENAGTADDWEDFRTREIEQCPKLHRIKEFCDSIDCFCYRIKRKYWSEPIWWYKNMFIHPQWKVIPKTMKKGKWYDSVERILHVNMEMLRYFIEEENHNYGNEKGDFEPWEVKEFRKKEAGEPSQFDGEDGLSMCQYQYNKDAWDIYLWWKDYPRRQKEIEDIYSEIPERKKGNSVLSMFTKENSKIAKPYYDRIHDLEKKLEQETKDNLNKLMEIRLNLWS